MDSGIREWERLLGVCALYVMATIEIYRRKPLANLSALVQWVTSESNPKGNFKYKVGAFCRLLCYMRWNGVMAVGRVVKKVL